MSLLRLDLPTTPPEVLLWSHACLVWILVNFAHRLDPLSQAEARSLDEASLRKWRASVVLRSLVGAVAVAALTGFRVLGIGLGVLFLVGAVVLPMIRVRWMRAPDDAGWRDFRAEWELAVTTLYLAASALVIGVGDVGLAVAAFEVPFAVREVALALVAASGAVFLVRGGTHVVRGILEKTDTLPKDVSESSDSDVRHGVTIGNIERPLIYLFALVGSPAAIGLVLAAKGVVRAVEWRERAMVEYFLIGTLVSAGLAAAVGIGIRWLWLSA